MMILRPYCVRRCLGMGWLIPNLCQRTFSSTLGSEKQPKIKQHTRKQRQMLKKEKLVVGSVHNSKITQQDSNSFSGRTKSASARDWTISSFVSQKLHNIVLNNANDPYQYNIFKKKSVISDSGTNDQYYLQLKTVKVDFSEVENLLNTKRYNEFKTLLESIDWNKMPEEHLTRTMGNLERIFQRHLQQMEKEIMLYIADFFFALRYKANRYYRMMSSTFDLRWENMDIYVEHVIQLLFYLSVFRNAPGQLMYRIENFLELNIDKIECTGNELGLVCQSFFVTNTSIKSYTLLYKIFRKVLACLDSVEPSLLQSVLKAVQHGGLTDVQLYIQLGDQLRNQHMFGYNNLSGVASAFASARITHPALFKRIRIQFANYMTENRKRPRSKALSRLIWAFATLDSPVPQELTDHLIHQYTKDQRLVLDYPEVFLQALVGMSIKGIYPPKLLDWAFSPEFLTNLERSLQENYYQLLLLHCGVEAECPDYKGNRLTQEFVKKIPKESLGNRGLQLFQRTGLAAVWLMLEELLGGPQYVLCHFVLPFTRIPDIEIKLDQDGQLVPFPSDCFAHEDEELREKVRHKLLHGAQEGTSVFQQLLRERNQLDPKFQRSLQPIHLLPNLQMQYNRRIIVKVLGWNQYVLNADTLLGVHQMELRCLSKLGYEVIGITPVEAAKLEDMCYNRRKTWLFSRVIQQCSIKLPSPS